MEDKNKQEMKCPVWSKVTNKSEGKMYGILLESIQFYVVRDVGQDTWHRILEHAGIKNMIFTTHDTYKDELMISLAKSCCHVIKTMDFNGWMTFFGTCFVDFCSGYGYDKLLRVSGRNYRDFLHGIDNIHEIIRFSYPRLQSPSFLVVSEDTEGCVLLYQSKRHGFKHYVKGQLQQCAKKFYNVHVNITIIEEVFAEGRTHVKFRLDFDNSVYIPETLPENISGKQEFSSISGDRFLQVFPFSIVFNNQLIIKSVGPSMVAFIKGDNLVGSSLREKFLICRPLIPCIWSKILRFQGVIFELEYIHAHADDVSEFTDIDNESNINGIPQKVGKSEKTFEERILLRGEMKYIKEWDRVAFLCTPLINNLKHLRSTGLFINDLNMFDMSRDMVMAGCQHASQLERSIEKQRAESEIISKNMGEIEAWKKKSNSLLYSMIPQTIADRLKSGEPPINTCELFDNVTIMFNYMVGFADICANSRPMEIVNCINDVFSLFDKIIDRYDVFKVETLGDAVYMVAGGVPDRSPDHAINVAGLALELQEKAKSLLDPMSIALNTRIGMHTGSVVGGVVGRRMPQYCLFGDTVNTASRMQTYSMPGRIHLSEPCYECLKESDFVTVVRGTVNIKGKGEMKTYWLAGKSGEATTQEFLEKIKEEKSHAILQQSSYENALDLHGMHASTSSAQISANFVLKKQTTSNLLQKRLSVKTMTQLPTTDNTLLKHNVLFDARDELKDYVTVPAISVTESPSDDIVLNTIDNASEDSVSFFLNTADNSPCDETKPEDAVSVQDIQLEVPEVPDDDAQTDDPDGDSSEQSQHDSSDKFVSIKEEDSVVDESSCVKFAGCPLFSSLFNAPALGCTSCAYFKPKKDDVDINNDTEQKKSMCNTRPSTETTMQNCKQIVPKEVKQSAGPIASNTNMLTPTMILPTDIMCDSHTPSDCKNGIQNSCIQGADTKDILVSDKAIKENKCALRTSLELTLTVSDVGLDREETCCSLSSPKSFSQFSSESSTSKSPCNNSVPLGDSVNCSDRTPHSRDIKVSSSQLHCEKNTTSQSVNSESSNCPMNLASQAGCPFTSKQRFTPNTKESRTLSHDKEHYSVCNGEGKDIEFQSELISCQNGKCIVNGDSIPNQTIDQLHCQSNSNDKNISPVSFYLEDVIQNVSHSKADVKRNSLLKFDKTIAITNGIDNYRGIPNGKTRDGIIHDDIDVQSVMHSKSGVHDKNCNMYSKSFSSPYRYFQSTYESSIDYHRCHSDPGTVSNQEKAQHVESNV